MWRHGKDGMSRVRFKEEQLDAINSTLSEVLEATHTANLTTIPDRGAYIQNVLLPEVHLWTLGGRIAHCLTPSQKVVGFKFEKVCSITGILDRDA